MEFYPHHRASFLIFYSSSIGASDYSKSVSIYFTLELYVSREAQSQNMIKTP